MVLVSATNGIRMLWCWSLSHKPIQHLGNGGFSWHGPVQDFVLTPFTT